MSALLPFLPAAMCEHNDVSKSTAFEIACIRLLVLLLLSSLSMALFHLHLIEILNSQKQEIHLSNILTCIAYVAENTVHLEKDQLIPFREVITVVLRVVQNIEYAVCEKCKSF